MISSSLLSGSQGSCIWLGRSKESRIPGFRASMASSSKLPSAHHCEDLSPMDTKVEEVIHNVDRLFSKRERIPYLYPYREHLKVEVLVPMLGYYPSGYVEWNKKYIEWRQKMWEVINSARLLGFIDGTVQAPPKTVITSFNGPNGGVTIHEERENKKYVAWKISDGLVRKWIRSRVSPFMVITKLGSLETAKEIWEAIARMEQKRRMNHYLPLYKSAIKGDWKTADNFIQNERDAVRARITLESETALIVAAKMVGGKDFVEKLVEKMLPDDLAIGDNGGRTALHRAAGFGNIEAAKLLVGMNLTLPNMETYFKETPLFYAAERGDRKMVDWLMEVTDPKLLKGERGFRILYQLTRSQLCDIALNVLRENKELAVFIPIEEEDLKFHALNALAEKTSSFPSGNTFNCVQELIYSSIKFQTKKNEGGELENTADNHSKVDIEASLASNNSGAENEGGELENTADNHSKVDIEASLASNNSGAANDQPIKKNTTDQLLIKPIREIREKKLLHNQALDLLRFLCNEVWNEVKTKDFSKADRIFQLPLEQATKLGIHEIVEQILALYPYAVYLENHKKQTIFQQAIVFRQEKVFNLIHQLEESTRAIVLSKRDTSNNNALHLAGYVAHSPKLNVRAGAALQMQRELQWFKAVERLAPSTNREERNKDGRTPAQVFTDTHKELVKEGEQWMKDTANSCIIVASLIATVVFAAAIQVPGGNNDNGRPIFEQQTAFVIFSIANSLALYSSIVSVIMFLSIITSPYAEEDFLFDLFRGMIIGLGSLFFSTLFTMTAFGAILYLMFGENKGILIPVVAFGFPPVYLFAAKQMPFLKDTWNSMHGMFFQQSNRVLL